METAAGRYSEIKDIHIKVCLERDVESALSTGLEKVRLAGGIPNFARDAMETSTAFLGRTLSLPLLIAPITGGGRLSMHINRNLAMAAEHCRIAMALGSARPMLEKRADAESYLVREWAPTIPLLANLGLVHARRGRDYLMEAVESIHADGIMLYVNPLHEILQTDGETDFSGALDALENALQDFPYPVFLKEVGAGLPESVVRWAAARKIAGVDVAGLGGTSWPRIEGYIQDKDYGIYENIGTCTRDAIIAAAGLLAEGQHLIAGGGIRSGIDMAKAFALGATLTSMALPFLRWSKWSAEKVIEGVERLKEELLVSLWCSGSRTIGELRDRIAPEPGC
ncbi:MAG: alpha-hydroxy-acid oxidizing protein [Syntrophorhabdales bacterium]|jgi:isopentenyl-diphosphate delta-isomerase